MASEVICANQRLLESQELEFESKQEALQTALIAGENSGDSDMQIDDIIANARQYQLTNRTGLN
jgi:Arc/MetJ-type ribon-helix-helix transcriptional regulator